MFPKSGRSLESSGTKNEPKPKLFGPAIFWWVRGLPRQGVGAKKFGMPLEIIYQGRKIHPEKIHPK